MVMGITIVIAAIAVPTMTHTLGDFRLRGDAHALNSAASLAKLRAAADFTQVRLYADLSTNRFHIESWLKTATPPGWAPEGGTTTLAQSDRFSFGVVSTSPSGDAISQAAPCVTSTGAPIANTACVLFNSRGIPVDASGAPPNVGAPTGSDGLYVTDNTAVYGLTLSATGQITLWRTNPRATPAWVLQ